MIKVYGDCITTIEKKQVKIIKNSILVKISSMIDLIDECGQDLKGLGYEKCKDGLFSLTSGRLEVDSAAKAKQTGFDKGSYYIYNCPLLHEFGRECFDYVSDEVGKGLRRLMRKHGLNKKSRILLVGLGNPKILADSLGSLALDKVEMDPFKKSLRLFKFAPNIFSATGINSFDVVHMLAIWLDVDGVIVIDSLATNSISRLATSFQLNDAGMTPGSAVNNLGQKLCRATLGVTCLSIGVPTMLLAGKAKPDWPDDLILTPKDVHQNLENVARVVAEAINKYV